MELKNTRQSAVEDVLLSRHTFGGALDRVSKSGGRSSSYSFMFQLIGNIWYFFGFQISPSYGGGQKKYLQSFQKRRKIFLTSGRAGSHDTPLIYRRPHLFFPPNINVNDGSLSGLGSSLTKSCPFALRFASFVTHFSNKLEELSLGTSIVASPKILFPSHFFLLLTPHHYNTQKNDLCSDLRVRRLLTAFITAVLPVSEIPLIEPLKPKSLPWETDLLQLWKVHQFLKVPSTPKWLMSMSTMNQKHQHLRA